MTKKIINRPHGKATVFYYIIFVKYMDHLDGQASCKEESAVGVFFCMEQNHPVWHNNKHVARTDWINNNLRLVDRAVAS